MSANGMEEVIAEITKGKSLKPAGNDASGVYGHTPGFGKCSNGVVIDR